MRSRFNWASCWRADRGSPWLWVCSGCTYGESNGCALAKVGTGGETVTLFGRRLPPGKVAEDYWRRAAR
jgi:hypothetical protein